MSWEAVIETVLLLLFAGWQPRWFLLCGGILSYYDSPEDAWKGCKGSIQMAVCEIQGEKPRDLQGLIFCFSPKIKKKSIGFLGLSVLLPKYRQRYVMFPLSKKTLQVRPKTAGSFYKKIG